MSLTYNHQPGLDGGFNFPTSRSIAEGYDLHPFSSLPGLASSEMNGDEYLDFSGDDFQGTRVEQDEQYSHLDTGSFARNSSHGWASWVQPDPAMSIFPLLNDGPTPPDTNVLANASSSALAAEIKLDRTELGTFPSYPSVSSDGTSELFVPNFGATRGQPHFPSQIPLNFDERQSPLFGSSGSTSENFSPAPVLSSTVDRSNPYITNQPLAYPAATHTEKIRHTAHIDPIDGLTERLGEFLFSPTEESARTEDGWAKKRRGTKGSISRLEVDGEGWLVRNTLESDGLTDDTRNLLCVMELLTTNLTGHSIDCFLAHSRLFFEMSIPRFRYRLTLCDRRRPSLALLNAMVSESHRYQRSHLIVSLGHTDVEQSSDVFDGTNFLQRRIQAAGHIEREWRPIDGLLACGDAPQRVLLYVGQIPRGMCGMFVGTDFRAGYWLVWLSGESACSTTTDRSDSSCPPDFTRSSLASFVSNRLKISSCGIRSISYLRRTTPWSSPSGYTHCASEYLRTA